MMYEAKQIFLTFLPYSVNLSIFQILDADFLP